MSKNLFKPATFILGCALLNNICSFSTTFGMEEKEHSSDKNPSRQTAPEKPQQVDTSERSLEEQRQEFQQNLSEFEQYKLDRFRTFLAEYTKMGQELQSIRQETRKKQLHAERMEQKVRLGAMQNQELKAQILMVALEILELSKRNSEE